jgi:hypothetical protein
VSLLRAAEVEAQVALLSDDAEIASDVPWLGQLGHVMVVARVGRAERFFPIGRHASAAPEELDGERWMIRIDQPGPPTRVAAAPAAASTARLVATLTVGADRAVRGDLDVSLGGAVNPYHALRAAGRGIDRVLGDLAASVVADATTDDAIVERFGPDGAAGRARLEGLAAAEGASGEIVTLGVPWPGLAEIEAVDLREGRQTPLVTPGPRVLAARVTVSLPPAWVLVGHPRDIERRCAAGWLRQQVVVDGSRAEIVRELGIARRLVEPGADAAALRDLLAEALVLRGEVLVLDTAPAR